MTHQDIDSCKQDIEIIKSTIEKSKVNLGSIAKLFIFFGVCSFITTVLGYLPRYFIDSDQFLAVYIICLAVDLSLKLMLILLYAKHYRKFKNTNNIYTLQLFRTWGIVMFMIPIFSTCILLLSLGLFQSSLRFTLLFLSTFIEVIAFIMAAAFTGIVLNKKVLSAVSLCALPALLLLFNFSGGFPDSASFDNAYPIFAYMSHQANVCEFMSLIGYIVMGIYLLPKKGTKK